MKKTLLLERTDVSFTILELSITVEIIRVECYIKFNSKAFWDADRTIYYGKEDEREIKNPFGSDRVKISFIPNTHVGVDGSSLPTILLTLDEKEMEIDLIRSPEGEEILIRSDHLIGLRYNYFSEYKTVLSAGS